MNIITVPMMFSDSPFPGETTSALWTEFLEVGFKHFWFACMLYPK